MTSLDELQVSEWAPTSDIPNSNRGGRIESDKLGLILGSINSLRGVLGAYLHLLVPALLKLSDSLASLSSSVHMALPESALFNLQVQSLRTTSILLEYQGSSKRSTPSSSMFLGEVCQNSTESGLSARSVQPLVRLLRTRPPVCHDVGIAIIETLCVCAQQIGAKRWYASYHDVVETSISSWESLSARTPIATATGTGSNTQTAVSIGEEVYPAAGLEIYYDVLKEFSVPQLQRKSAISFFSNTFVLGQRNAYRQMSFHENAALTGQFESTGVDVWNQTIRQKVNQGNLQRAWDVTQRASREDYDEWMRRLAINLLREAPSPALRATANLAHAYQPLARELFSAAFVCCWKELSEPYRINLIHALETVFVADVSPEILQVSCDDWIDWLVEESGVA